MKVLSPQQARNLLWNQGHLDFLLHSGQLKIKQTLDALPPSTREFVVLCSRRYGKSYLGIVLALEKCLQNPNQRVAIIGPTYVHTQKIILPLLKNHVAKSAPKGLLQHTKSEFMWRFKNGSELIISSFEGAVEVLRGQFLDLALLEESALANSDEFEYITSSVIFPTLLHSRGKIIHLTTPAVSPEHYFNSVLLPKLEERGAVIKKTVYDNPLLTETDIEEAMDKCGGEQSAHWQREFLCNVALDKAALVVPAYSDSHITKSHELPPGARHWVAVDWGGVRDLTVWLLMAFDYRLKKVVVLKEQVFQPSTPTSSVLEAIRPLEREVGSRWVDAPGQLLVDLSTAGYQCQLPVKMDWMANLEGLNSAFHNNEIMIDESCKLLIKTLKKATFNRGRTDFERGSDIGHADALAALMYGWRMADRTEAPYKVMYSSQTHWVPDGHDVDSLTELAKSLNPGIVRKRK
jgi:hypothetical protein